MMRISGTRGLAELFHHRWAVPTLATLGAKNAGARFITLQRSLGVSRDSLARTLSTLIDLNLVMRNPGYGHPLRPEFVLTRSGHDIARVCKLLMEELRRIGIVAVAMNKWSLPVAYALSSSGGRFNGLIAKLETISPRALALALNDLQDGKLVKRLLIDAAPPRTEYILTPRGRRLLPVLIKLARAA